MSQPSGWYDDPQDPARLRYWDGVLWTEHTTPKKAGPAEGSSFGQTPDIPAYGGHPAQAQDQPVWTAGTEQGSPHPPATPGGPYPPASPAGGYPPTTQGSPYPPTTPGSGYPPAQGYDRPPPSYGYGSAPQVAWHGGGPTAPDGARLADWWQRLLARIIDSIIIGVLLSIVGFPWLASMASELGDFWAQAIREAESGVTSAPDQSVLQEQLMQYILPLTLVTVAVGVLYETFFLVRSGATPGKKVLGITVRRVNQPGPLSVVDALRRQLIQQGCNLLSLVPALSLITIVLQPLDVLWLLWDSRRQALHDKVADTLVVRVPKIR